MAMTSEAKRALAKTIRGLRGRLLDDLHAANEGAYRLSLAPREAGLAEAAAKRRARLQGWIDEQPGAKGDKAVADRLRREVEAQAGTTLLHRLVLLRLLEAAGLRDEVVVTGGWASNGYRLFRDLAPELVAGDDTEGYATLLRLVFEDLAGDLPGLFGDVGLTALVPVPAATLRAVIEALDDPALASCWTDDTTLGWVYQYWNDPAREALDKKLADGGKVAPHEIASKTQMFTERYMVEWLLHNSLGPMWLAICKKNGWTPEVVADGTLDRLEARRADWRGRRERGEVPLDGLMPIHGPAEERWKYFVPQPLPDDAVASARDSVWDVTVLDPACGSGHFLVLAFDLLFALCQEEARHRGQARSDREIALHLLEDALFGIDIDPRAVQIAAAALWLKARTVCRDVHPRRLGLVAPAFRLGALADDDPALVELRRSVKDEVGLPDALTDGIVHALKGADHLGTLLKVDQAIDTALSGTEWLGTARQVGLWERATQEQILARRTVVDRIEAFLARHSGGDDLGLRLRGEQLAAGIRFLRLVREGTYDLVVGNPPYQGTSKMEDAAYVQKHYPRGKADLYAAFLERGLELCRIGGTSALLTMRNWMFIQQYTKLREHLLQGYDLRALGDFDRGAFEDVPDEVVSVVGSVFRRAPPGDAESVALQPTPLDDKSRDSERTRRKRAAVLASVGRFAFDETAVATLPGSPGVYWWSRSQIESYRTADKLGESAPCKVGIVTGNNVRFTRHHWELSTQRSWVPYVTGAKGMLWFDPCDDRLNWGSRGLETKVLAEFLYGSHTRQVRNEDLYFRVGIACTAIGADFGARLHRRPAVIGSMAASVFPDDTTTALCMLNSSRARFVLQSLNPGIHFEVSDVNRLPVHRVDGAHDVLHRLEQAFSEHEAHREPSVEFKRPGPSPWRSAQDWAQRAVDRPEGAPLPPYEPVLDPEPPTDHVSFAVGVALGRFGAHGEGVLDEAPDTALPDGLLFLDGSSEHDSLADPAAAPIRRAWDTHGPAIDPQSDARTWLRLRFFPDVHRKMYENRPIYLPLSSAKKTFVAFASIHRFTGDTLRALLANHLHPALVRLRGEQDDLRAARASGDKAATRAAEKRFAEVGKLVEELSTFVDAVQQCAERGPTPPSAACPKREVDARYVPDLDDGVMINAAGLWPLLSPQWKDPEKWWTELCTARGRADYDWSHLAARYFPSRVRDKCAKDPSLAVAHGCFWRLHPARAWAWELRLQDEIAPDFTIDEPGSDEARQAFLRDHPAEAAALRDKESKRRARKGTPDDDAPALPLDPDPD